MQESIIEIDKGSSTMSISMIESMIDSCTGCSTLHEIMRRSRICARIYARINDRFNQAVWFYDRFLQRVEPPCSTMQDSIIEIDKPCSTMSISMIDSMIDPIIEIDIVEHVTLK